MNSFRVHVFSSVLAAQQTENATTLPGRASASGDTVLFWFGVFLLVASIVFLAWWSTAIRRKK